MRMICRQSRLPDPETSGGDLLVRVMVDSPRTLPFGALGALVWVEDMPIVRYLISTGELSMQSRQLALKV